jgi:site-specific DNA recombinase
VIKAINPETGQIKSRGGTIGLNPNNNTQAIVLKEYELRAKGYSLEDIRTEVRASGLLSAKQSRRYNIATIDGRLKNPFYKGQFLWLGKLYQGKHPVFIPADLIAAVEKTFGKKASAIVREESEHNILMGGGLKCSCGCNVVYDPKTKVIKSTGETKTYHYLHCTNGKEAHQGQKGLITTTDKVWGQLGNIMDKISISEEFANDIAEALNKLNSKTKNVIHLQQAELKNKCKELEIQEDQLTELLINKTVDKQAYDRQLVRIRGNREDLLGQLEQLRLSLQDTFMESVQSILELATSAKSLWIRKSAQERKDFLNMILSNPTLEGVNVRYELKKPFAVLVNMSKNEDWCPGPDLNWHVGITQPRILSPVRLPISPPGPY